MYVNIVIYSNKLLLFVWSTLQKEKKKIFTILTVLFRRCLTLFKSMFTFSNVDSTLFNIVNSSVDVHNTVSMLIWHCPTSRRHIKPRTTLKQRRNVCQDGWIEYPILFIVLLILSKFSWNYDQICPFNQYFL